MEQWHDLRRDPDDVPKIGEKVDCVCRGRRALRMTFHGRTWTYQDEEHTKTYVHMWRRREANGEK